MTINELVRILLEETEHDNRTPRVLQVIREKIDPEIGRMSGQELRDELSNAIYALYQRGCIEYVLEDNLEHFKEEASSSNTVAEFLQTELEIAPEKERKRSSKNATDAKYEENRQRNKEIKKIWATGKYSNKNVCADEEWEALGFGSKKTARNALDKEPNPSPWPAKEKS